MKLKKFMAICMLSILACMTFITFSGCFRRGQQGEDIDPNRTQVYIGNFGGGLGEQWLKNAKAEFEKIYPKAQIMINTNQDLYNDSYLSANWDGMTEDIYVLSMGGYYDYVHKDRFEDITTAVTTPLSEFNETESIENKMDEGFKTYIKTNDKYYGLPLYSGSTYMVYNKEVFRSYGLYMKEGGGFVRPNSDDPKTVGGDGKEGTYDDGLPVTLSEFKTLMDRMVRQGVTPFIWTGQHGSYFAELLASVWFDYEGYDNAELFYTMNGSYTFHEESTPTPISYKNAYLLQKQWGKHYMLEFMKTILDGEGYTRTECFDQVSQTAAQSKFLLSEETSNPIGILVEGTWWENEAKITFQSLVNQSNDPNDAYGKKEFGILPVPKADDGTSASGHTYYGNSGQSVIGIRKGSKVKDLAVKFVQFLHTDSMLSMMTATTGIPRPYDYELSDEQLAAMTPFAREVLEVNESTKYVYGNRKNAFSQYNPDYFNWIAWEFNFLVKGSTTSELFPQNYYKFTSKDKSIEPIYEGFLNYYDVNKWNAAVAKFEQDTGITA